MDWLTEDAAQKAFDYLRESEEEFAEAAGQRVHIEEGRKSMLAIISSRYNEGSEAERERKARSDQEYLDYLKGLAQAVRRHELFRAKRARALATIEAWRSAEASRRGMAKVG